MDTIEIIKSLGFTEYEAKVYLALLTESPVTGYAAAKNSGVPRSKVYEVLNSLLARGYVLASPGEPPLYRPLPVRDLIAALRRREDETLSAAEAALSRLELSGGDRENIWNITGREAIMQRVQSCILAAERRIFLELWAEDYPDLAEALRAAAARGVSVTIVAYGEIPADYARVYRHEGGEAITEEYGGRWIVFSADDSQVVAGVVSLGAASRAAWTRHPGLVMPITEVILHDLYLAEILKEYRGELEARFGKDLVKLRGMFSDDPALKKHYFG